MTILYSNTGNIFIANLTYDDRNKCDDCEVSNFITFTVKTEMIFTANIVRIGMNKNYYYV